MASNRRMGQQSAATGAALMDATEAVMREEGYAAVTSRRVAERAGVNQQTVYYYFQTMDELRLAAYRRRTQRVLEGLEQALACARPLHALWRTSSDPFDAALTMEYLALANHNELIRLETIEFGERVRRLEVDKLAERISQTSSDPHAVSPFAVIMAITYIAHLLGFEATLGLRGGHKETRVLVEWWLRQLEPIGARANAMPELS
jgi:AcrR family transcriptional regulator